MEILLEILEAVLENLGGVFVNLTHSALPNPSFDSKIDKILRYVSTAIVVLLFYGQIVGLILLLTSGGESVGGWILVLLLPVWIAVSVVIWIVKRNKYKE